MSEPFDSMSMSDATVTLRSLHRRFSEVVAGPVGDDAWDRTVRSVGPSGRSALAALGRADAELVALGTAIAALPLTKTPVVNLGPLDRKTYDGADGTVADALAALKQNAERAATAIHGRGHEDFARSVTIDGKPVHADAYVRRAVEKAMHFLKDAQAAIDAAGS